MKGSRQLRLFLGARRTGASLEDAARLAGFDMREAREHDASEAKGIYADYTSLAPPAPDPKARALDLAPNLERLTKLIGFCEQRLVRANEKMCAAQAEYSEGSRALDDARTRLAAWIAANPEPQKDLVI